MSVAIDPESIPRMLAQPREETCVIVQNGRVVCGPGAIRDTLTRIEALLQTMSQSGQPFRAAVLSDDVYERAEMATAIIAHASALGLSAKLIRSAWGQWAVAARQAEPQSRIVYVLTAVPPANKAREGFASTNYGLVLLWPLTHAGDASLPDGIEELLLPPLGDRPLDKAAQVISSATENLDPPSAADDEQQLFLLKHVDSSALLAICSDASKLKTAAEAQEAGLRLADALRTHAALRRNEPPSPVEIYQALCPTLEHLPPNLRRLWVEGETDKILLETTDRLFPGLGLLESIKIEVLGGATQIEAALQRCNRPSSLELFMFDGDLDGRKASEEVGRRKFPTLILDRNSVMSACDQEWVIEDLVSVACLDRFYHACPSLRPAREEIEHQPMPGRRLVIRGEDKLALANWLATNATPADVGGLFHQLLLIRRKFSLRERTVISQAPSPDVRRGLRPEPWWFISGAGSQ